MKTVGGKKEMLYPLKPPLRLIGDFSPEITEINENWLASSKCNTNKNLST